MGEESDEGDEGREEMGMEEIEGVRGGETSILRLYAT